jgi:hypothetical protein
MERTAGIAAPIRPTLSFAIVNRGFGDRFCDRVQIFAMSTTLQNALVRGLVP